ncbi:TadE-like protein [compost metagenome]
MNRQRMRGVYAVEFAIVGLLLFILLFGVLEMGRLLFTVNTLNEAARRGARLAAVCDIRDPAILRKAIFADADSTTSALIRNLEAADVRLRYFDGAGAEVTDPTPAGGFTRIRFVQVSIEETGIQGFRFNLMIPVLGREIILPPFRSVLPRESLGRHAEEGVVPEITPC